MSSALPCGKPSTTSKMTMSPSSFRPASRASVPPILPPPTRAIFLRAMGKPPEMAESQGWKSAQGVAGIAPAGKARHPLRRHVRAGFRQRKGRRIAPAAPFFETFDASARRHTKSTIEADGLAVQHHVLADVARQSGIFLGAAEPRGIGHRLAKALLRFRRQGEHHR